MITKKLEIEALRRFPSVYMNFLVDNIYKDEEYVQSMFAKDETINAFVGLVRSYFGIIEDFYRIHPNGTYVEELEYVANNKELKEYIEQK